MTAVNFNAGNTQLFQTRQNPEAYAKTYAEQNGITIEEAREQLKAKYGDPGQGMGNPSIFAGQTSENSYYDFSSSNLDIMDFDFGGSAFGAHGQNMQMPNENGGIKSLFQKFLDFLKGGNGPKAEGDPQSHLNPETNTVSGPKKEGDFNPKEGIQTGSNGGVQLHQNSPMGNAQDPDKMAREYAEANNITLDEAKAQLKELYGEPQQK